MIADCSAAILLNHRSFKAFYRRAEAYVQLGHWCSAADDLTKATQLNPDNAVVHEKLQNVLERIR